MIREYKTVLDADTRICVLQEVAEYEAAIKEREIGSSPNAVVEMLNRVFELNRQSEEYVYLVCLDVGLNVNGVFEISHGSISNADCQPREVYQKALLCNAAAIIVAHNHTSGSCNPSKDDDKICEALKNAGEILCVKLTDFIVVGNSNYTSYREMGCIA